MRGLRFRPTWWGALLAAATCALTVSLGNWQARRADEKRALAQRFDESMKAASTPVPGKAASADALVMKRLTAKGRFLPQFTILLDNKVYHGRTGYFVVTPLRLEEGPMNVLVNRGWIAAGARREAIPNVVTPSEEVTIEGYGLEHAPRVLATGSAAPVGKVWQGIRLDEFSNWSGLVLQPVFLEQHSPLADGLIRDWARPDFGIDRHTSYAVQWYLIAALSIVIFVTLSFNRDRHPAR